MKILLILVLLMPVASPDSRATECNLLKGRDFRSEIFQNPFQVASELNSRVKIKRVQFKGKYYQRRFYFPDFAFPEFVDVAMELKSLLQSVLDKNGYEKLNKSPHIAVDVQELNDLVRWVMSELDFFIQNPKDIQNFRALNLLAYWTLVYEVILLPSPRPRPFKTTFEYLYRRQEVELWMTRLYAAISERRQNPWFVIPTHRKLSDTEVTLPLLAGIHLIQPGFREQEKIDNVLLSPVGHLLHDIAHLVYDTEQGQKYGVIFSDILHPSNERVFERIQSKRKRFRDQGLRDIFDSFLEFYFHGEPGWKDPNPKKIVDFFERFLHDYQLLTSSENLDDPNYNAASLIRRGKLKLLYNQNNVSPELSAVVFYASLRPGYFKNQERLKRELRKFILFWEEARVD